MIHANVRRDPNLSWDMRRFFIAVGLAMALPLWTAQAAGPDLVIEDYDAASVAEETHGSVTSDRAGDPVNQNYGILTGKPIVQLDPKYGDICVQAIYGKINGAQLRVTW